MSSRQPTRPEPCHAGAPAHGLSVRHVPRSQSDSLADDARTLAVVGFGEHCRAESAQASQLTVGLPALGGSPQSVEVWRSSLAAQTVIAGDVVLRVAGDIAFGHVLLHEAACGDLQNATYQAYCGILRALRDHGFPHLQRVWHYFPDIHGDDNGMERYQAFCVGRHRALSGTEGFERNLPAATAIGSRTPGLLIYFIAAAGPGTQIENPRQLSAFRYPRQYGPSSPSFSRAMHSRQAGGDTLFISGTASVRGHSSQHAGNLAAQLDETLANLCAVVDRAAGVVRRSLRVPHDLDQLKVYLRDPSYLNAAAALLHSRFGTTVPTLFLQGDVCRTDLLLEVEAVCSSP